MICIYRTADGVAVSFGTVVADPLPDGLASVDVGDIEGKRWDPATLTMVDVPAEPAPQTLAEIAAEYTAPITADDLVDILARYAATTGGA